jgi:hypothetical protein
LNSSKPTQGQVDYAESSCGSVDIETIKSTGLIQ